MDNHIHNNYNILLNTIIHLMIFDIYNNDRLNINNAEQQNRKIIIIMIILKTIEITMLILIKCNK